MKLKFGDKMSLGILLMIAMTTYFVQETMAHGTHTRYARNCEEKYVCKCGKECNIHECERKCIPRKQLCDNNPNCPNGDDEEDCPCEEGDDAFGPRNTRHYYLCAEEMEWDYLHTGLNQVDNNYEYIDANLVNGPNRIGSKYWKYFYQMYTNATYTEMIPSPPGYGFLPPCLYGMVGERILVHLKNTLNVSVSAHPHGFRYLKDSEGALYEDGTSGSDKKDDGVTPGDTYTYVWDLTKDFEPQADDDNCNLNVYHSHVMTNKDVNAGLQGCLVVCKPGILDKHGRRKDVEREYPLHVDSWNENHSWLMQKNLQRCGNVTECQNLHANGDPDFEESNKADAINGKMFGNLEDIEVCVGQSVVFYIWSLEAEIHPVHISGHSFLHYSRRSAVLGMFSASFKTARIISAKPGRWLISCLNSEHNTMAFIQTGHPGYLPLTDLVFDLSFYQSEAPVAVCKLDGMRAFMWVKQCPEYSMDETLSGVERHYYLRAEDHDWKYAPGPPPNKNFYQGGPAGELLTTPGSYSEFYFATSATRIGGTYKKTSFFSYSDNTFSTPAPSMHSDYLGFLGPPIYCEVGDVVIVTVNNAASFPISFYPQGLAMDKDQDGTFAIDRSTNTTEGRIVNPGETITYTFEVPSTVRPMDDDPDCLTNLYYSNVDYDRDVNTGLVGYCILCKPGTLVSNPFKPKCVDHERFIYLSDVDENLSHHIDDNIAVYAPGADPDDEDFQNSNKMHSINGYSYGNLPITVATDDICHGDTVMWHVSSFGEGGGLHGLTWNGNNVLIDGVLRPSHMTISALSFTGVMTAYNAGLWALTCRTAEHYNAGMTALYRVDECGPPHPPHPPHPPFLAWSGHTRTFYVASVIRSWDYAPNKTHPVTLEDLTDPSSDQYNRYRTDEQYIGTIYNKTMYRGFTDATFNEEKNRTLKDIHLGVMGPFICGEAGDKVVVHFKNMANRPYSMHAMGWRYSKENEGMPYYDTLGSQPGDSVAAGDTFVYEWTVPTPRDSGPNCVGSIYHSAVDPSKDIYTGLFGPTCMCKRGTLDADGERNDEVTRSIAVAFLAFNENESWNFDMNVNQTALAIYGFTEPFYESNMFDSINGWIFGNLIDVEINVGEIAVWYGIGLGGKEDVHTIHVHGEMLVYRGVRAHITDVLEVFPNVPLTAQMYAENNGTFFLHCHVTRHMDEGMAGVYTIKHAP